MPSSATTCTHNLSKVAAPGIVPMVVGNSGYLFIGKARGEVLFQLGLLDFDLGGVEGIFTLTALISFIFIFNSCLKNEGIYPEIKHL